jgi:hypothetical protein
MSRKLGGSKLTKPYNRQWLTKNPVELFCRLFKCTQFTQVEAMRAEIGNDEGGAGLRRIRAPGRLLAVAFSGAG